MNEREKQIGREWAASKASKIELERLKAWDAAFSPAMRRVTAGGLTLAFKVYLAITDEDDATGSDAFWNSVGIATDAEAIEAFVAGAIGK